jgi:hypothetical protein
MNIFIARSESREGGRDIHFPVTYQNIGPASFSGSHEFTVNFEFTLVGEAGALLPTSGESFDLILVPEPSYRAPP